MVMMAPIVAGGIMAGAGLLGSSKSKSNQFLERALQEFERLEGRAPTAEEMQVVVQKYVSAGVLTPEEADTVLMDATAFNDINLDPTTRNAQADALRQLSEITDQGGMTAIDKSRVMEINDEIDTNNRGAQLAITQNMAERGTLGSGAELAARLSGQQNASSTAARRSVDVAAEAQQRALEAIMQKGQLGGQMRGQDYEQAARKAAARDEINRFNTGNRQNVINANADRVNRSREINLTNAQDLSNRNTEAENTNRVRNADLKQREFENRMNIARGKTGQLTNMAAAEEEEAARRAAKNNALIGLGSQVMSGGFK